MTKRKLLALGFTSLAVLVASTFWFRSDVFFAAPSIGRPDPKLPGSTTNGIEDSANSHQSPNSKRAASNVVSILMPPPNVPALEVIARLESAANSGNAPASCRIAVDLQDCAARKSQLAAAGAMEQSIRTTGASSKMLENLTGGLLAASDLLEAKCAGITDKQLALAFNYQIKAAKGNPNLARWLVANPALDRSLFMDQLDEWRNYRDFANNYLSSALTQPSAENLPLLLSAYKPRSYPSMELIHREDPAMFLALVELAQRGGAPLPNDILEHARTLRSSPSIVEASSRQRSALEDAGWGSVALDRSDFTPGPLVRPSIEQCSQVL